MNIAVRKASKHYEQYTRTCTPPLLLFVPRRSITSKRAGMMPRARKWSPRKISRLSRMLSMCDIIPGFFSKSWVSTINLSVLYALPTSRSHPGLFPTERTRDPAYDPEEATNKALQDLNGINISPRELTVTLILHQAGLLSTTTRPASHRSKALHNLPPVPQLTLSGPNTARNPHGKKGKRIFKVKLPNPTTTSLTPITARATTMTTTTTTTAKVTTAKNGSNPISAYNNTFGSNTSAFGSNKPIDTTTNSAFGMEQQQDIESISKCKSFDNSGSGSGDNPSASALPLAALATIAPPATA
ncbi:MAG: hypothetical protein J3R72DRAFT_523892 [Linnemannia gamsii]|nr:MAG: hypothetical protein J3R72DRAFT_523892 [Linnemannia gamsii]